MVGSPAAVGGPRRCEDFEADAGPIDKSWWRRKRYPIAYVKQNQTLPFLGHKIVKEWLQKHTDTSITGRCKSRPVLIGQGMLVLYSNGPLVRDS